MKWIALAIGVLCACTKTTPQAGSQTHFLAECEDGCAAPYLCICGVCTRICGGDHDDCIVDHPAASCVPRAGIAPACENWAPVCDLDCDADADCSALGAGYRCEEGRCRGSSVSTAGGSGGKGHAGSDAHTGGT